VQTGESDAQSSASSQQTVSRDEGEGETLHTEALPPERPEGSHPAAVGGLSSADRQLSFVDGIEVPNHKPPENIPVCVQKTRILRFQAKWYETFPWLHYVRDISAVICFTCAKAEASGLLNLERPQAAFTTAGFSNWLSQASRLSAGADTKSTSDVGPVV